MFQHVLNTTLAPRFGTQDLSKDLSMEKRSQVSQAFSAQFKMTGRLLRNGTLMVVVPQNSNAEILRQRLLQDKDDIRIRPTGQLEYQGFPIIFEPEVRKYPSN